MISAPLLVLFLPHEQVPPLVISLSLVNLLIALYPVRQQIDPNLVRRLIYGAVPGLPLGVWLLYWLDATLFKLVLGVLVVAAASLMLAGWRIKLKPGSWGWPLTGFISGVLSTSTSLSGPPVILTIASNKDDRDAFRANLLAYFAVLNVFSILAFAIGAYLQQGNTSQPATLFPFGLALWLLIPLLAGTGLGVFAASRISATQFKQVVLGVLAALGIFVTLSAIQGG